MMESDRATRPAPAAIAAETTRLRHKDAAELFVVGELIRLARLDPMALAEYLDGYNE